MTTNRHSHKDSFAAVIFLLLFLFSTSCFAWSGKVVGISDGDTITVMHDGKGEKIRLYGVDCPESHQDFGSRAKQFTSGKVFGKTVDIEPVDTDRYGRTVGIVKSDGQAINRTLIDSGMAWVYDQYCTRSECTEWRRLQEKAHAGKVGLWSIPNPTPPWEFRHSSSKSTWSMLLATNTSSGASTSSSQVQQTESAYHGNVKSHVFHRPSCRHYDCKNCTAVFGSRDEAIKAGYRPCGICGP
ncbi:MAG: nuclease [Deltaproteobacteria bacterium]|nr:nuclease [Deltaproteobacteria bacterium]